MKKMFLTIFTLMAMFAFTVNAQSFSSQIDLEPGFTPDLVDVELHYDGDHTSAVGAASTNFIAAIKLTPSVLAPYVGEMMTKVRFYIQNSPVGRTATIRIYSAGTAGAPGPEIYSQVVAVVDTQNWNAITLTTPVVIPATDLWIGIQATSSSTGFQFWAGTDAGPNHADGQYIYFSGAWTTLVALNATLIQNWNIRGIVNHIIPVELTSFTASNNSGNVQLNWSTATETNNNGFEIQRKSGSAFSTLGFIKGKGTTAETQSYSFVDKGVATGKYTYRLKQVDFNGNYDYTNEVEVEVSPSSFNLEQNYPNPFNPNTNIKFGLNVDSKVSVRLYNALGEEVASILNSNLTAGTHVVNFNAAGLTSGVYLYKLTATGIDGSSYSAAKKMILNK